MSFGDFLKSAISYASEYAQKNQQEYNRHYERYQNMDSERLKKYYTSSSGTKKMAIASVLRERNQEND